MIDCVILNQPPRKAGRYKLNNGRATRRVDYDSSVY